VRPERPRHSDERARTLRFAARGAARDVDPVLDPVPAELRYKSYAEQVNEQAVSRSAPGRGQSVVRAILQPARSSYESNHELELASHVAS
jgi:hypothetical protein